MKQAGIDMLAPEAGIPIVRRELTHGMRGEIVIGQKLGIMVQEFDSHGGLDTSATGPLEPLLRQRGVMTGKVAGMSLYGGLKVEVDLDPATQPFLFDHQINQTPVLPGVMGIEAMAETARLLFPERFVGAIEDVNFVTPFKFYRNQPRTVEICADFRVEKDDIVADCRLLGARTLHGQSEQEITTHFTGRVRLVSKQPKIVKERWTTPNSVPKVDASQVYRVFFHGPAYQVIDSAWRTGEEIFALFARNLPAHHVPPELPSLVSPRLIEFCFQTGSLSGLALQSRLGLPHTVREVRTFALPGKDSVLFSITSSNPDGSYDSRVVDEEGNAFVIVRGYQTMNLPDAVPADLLKPVQQALQAAVQVKR